MVSKTQRGLCNWKVCVLLFVYWTKSAASMRRDRHTGLCVTGAPVGMVPCGYYCSGPGCSANSGRLPTYSILAHALRKCHPHLHTETPSHRTPPHPSIFYRNKSVLILNLTVISANRKQNLSLYHSSANLKIYINLFMRWLHPNYASC
jgi:hypothetical protein